MKRVTSLWKHAKLYFREPECSWPNVTTLTTRAARIRDTDEGSLKNVRLLNRLQKRLYFTFQDLL